MSEAFRRLFGLLFFLCCLTCWSESESPAGEVHFPTGRKTNRHPSSPVKSFFEALSLDVKLEDGPLAIGGGVVAPTMLLKESIKAVFWGILLTAHKHHWDPTEMQQSGDRKREPVRKSKHKRERMRKFRFFFKWTAGQMQTVWRYAAFHWATVETDSIFPLIWL